MFALVILGMIVRVINALYTPLWRDEIYIFFISRNNSLWKLITQQHWDTAHPPLYSIFLHFWQMVSINPFWLRLPSLIASFFILYLIPIMAIKISKRYKSFPFIFLFLFSISHTQISLNMVVRPYPFISLCVIISLILFIKLVNEKQEDKKISAAFVLVNFIGFLIDYSIAWLFGCYFVFYFVNLLINRNSKKKEDHVFNALFFSFLVSCLVVPLAIKNINKSLNLEKYLANKFSNTSVGITSGSSISILYDKSDKNIYFLDKNFKIVKKIKSEGNLFQTKEVTITTNSSPLSMVIYKNLFLCSFDTNSFANIKNKYSNCLSDLGTTKVNNFQFIDPFTFKGKIYSYNFVINLRRRQWQNIDISKVNNTIKNRYVFFSGQIASLYFLLPPGINIYDKYFNLSNKNWWEGVSRITITNSLNNYVVNYINQDNRDGLSYLTSNDFYEKFKSDIFFFSGISSLSHNAVDYQMVLFLIVISGLSLLNFYRLERNSRNIGLLYTLIFFLPPFISLVVSYHFSPIFLARNLFITTFIYLVGLSLLLARINKTKLIYLILFLTFLRFITDFPYLHYVDPPYNLSSVISTINKSPHKEKYIVIESKDYFPLLKYEALRKPNRPILLQLDKAILEKSIELIDWKNKNYNYLKKDADIFFIEMGIQENESGSAFKRLSTFFDCHMNQIPIKYIYFATCN